MRARPTNLRLVEKTRYYRFTDEVDPDLAFICERILRSGASPSEIVDDIELLSDGRVRISYLTIFKWLEGRVKHPHNHSLVWVGRALGLHREWFEHQAYTPPNPQPDMRPDPDFARRAREFAEDDHG